MFLIPFAIQINVKKLTCFVYKNKSKLKIVTYTLPQRNRTKSVQTLSYSQICKLVMLYQIKSAKVTVQFMQCASSSIQLFAHANWRIWLGLSVAMETE